MQTLLHYWHSDDDNIVDKRNPAEAKLHYV